MRTLALTTLLATGLAAQANDDISYSYLELGYGYLDLPNSNDADGFYLEGAFDLSESIYLGGYFDNKKTNNRDFDRYGLKLGFHNDISKNTDFYSQLEVGRLDISVDESTTYGLFVGTRTAFNPRFELITKAGYTHVDKASDGYFEGEVKGLFKFNQQNAISAAVESVDGEFGAKLGYRFSF